MSMVRAASDHSLKQLTFQMGNKWSLTPTRTINCVRVRGGCTVIQTDISLLLLQQLHSADGERLNQKDIHSAGEEEHDSL